MEYLWILFHNKYEIYIYTTYLANWCKIFITTRPRCSSLFSEIDKAINDTLSFKYVIKIIFQNAQFQICFVIIHPEYQGCMNNMQTNKYNCVIWQLYQNRKRIRVCDQAFSMLYQQAKFEAKFQKCNPWHKQRNRKPLHTKLFTKAAVQIWVLTILINRT